MGIDDLQMKYYSANYVLASSNFVIQNLRGGVADKDLLPCLNVVRNIIQRGCPTMMSRYLQKVVDDEYTLNEDKKFTFWLGKNPNGWQYTIKGADNGYNPARQFYEEIVPREFGEAIQTMIIPEYGINDIVGKSNEEFVGQQVDFYLPQALLVIEIDGGQHKNDRMLDKKRVRYLQENGVETIRISTDELKGGMYGGKVEMIKERLQQKGIAERMKGFYDGYEHLLRWENLSEWELWKLRLTAVVRFELLILDLLEQGYLKLEGNWILNIRSDEPLGKCVEWAIKDVFEWLKNVISLRDKRTIERAKCGYKIRNAEEFRYNQNYVNIDFSILKRYTDENNKEPGIIFVRGDYFEYAVNGLGAGVRKNYFKVSISDPIKYHITDEDNRTLEFFLRNVFDKENFRPGQFPIIANALNGEDTVGLLPTGGGKSLCYQLPCMLQPCINFVVCPIKSLMIDQVQNLRGGDCRIGNVEMISSDYGAVEREKVMRAYGEGKYLFVLISPERFQVKEFRDEIRNIVNHYKMAYAVIDEVHCMSEWGHDFRTSYLNLTKTIEELSPKDEYDEGMIKFIGLTATASVSVLKDIRVEFSRNKRLLGDENIKSLLDYSRKELDFEVVKDGGNKYNALDKVFKKNNIPNEKEKATLIFTPIVNSNNTSYGCYELYLNLVTKYPNAVNWYSGSQPNNYILPKADFENHKKQVQRDFKNNKFNVLCATKAFGMGIDKDNIYYTVHYGLPGSIEALYQEAGRAGRWAKIEAYQDRRAKCYVLYTPVNLFNQPNVDMIFRPQLDVASMLSLRGTVGICDIETQLFLFLNGMNPINVDYTNIINLIATYYQPNQWVKIPIALTPKGKKDPNNDTEKHVYRLKLLGIVNDWMVDFKGNVLYVEFGEIKDERIIESVEKFIWKYEPHANVREGISRSLGNRVVYQALNYLLEWIHNNIIESRKQSLKNVAELCENYTTSKAFKERLDSYFVITDSTFVLQHISENPIDYLRWFDVFFDKGFIIKDGEFKKMKDRLSRFLESFHNNVGLNFVSGMIRLKLGEFENADGRGRLESALLYIVTEMENEKEEIYRRMIDLIDQMKLNEELIGDICGVIVEYYPEKTEELAGKYELPFLMNDAIEKNIKKLKTLNNKLYERFREI